MIRSIKLLALSLVVSSVALANTPTEKLFLAINENASFEEMRKLVDEGADINGVINGLPLIVAATIDAITECKFNGLKFLLHKCANVDAQTSYLGFSRGDTALKVATDMSIRDNHCFDGYMRMERFYPSVEAINLLLGYRANPLIKNEDGKNVVQSAKRIASVMKGSEKHRRIKNWLERAAKVSDEARSTWREVYCGLAEFR